MVEFIANFINSSTGSIAPETTIELTDYVNFGTDITHLAGSDEITLSEGYYLIEYSAVANIAAGGVAGITMTVNGVDFAESATESSAENATLFKSYIINVTETSVITFISSGTVNTTFLGVSVIIKELYTA